MPPFLRSILSSCLFFCIGLFLCCFTTILQAQHLPTDLNDIKPIQGKIMIKLKASNTTLSLHKLQNQLDNPIQPISIKRRFPTNLQHSKINLSKSTTAKANEIRLHDWYEVEFSEQINLEQALSYYQNQEMVEYAEPIYPNYILAPPYIPNDPVMTQQWHLGRVQLYSAWGLSQGDSNTVIGIVDTGVDYRHNDLKKQFKYNDAERYGRLGIDDDGNGFVDDSLGYNFGTNTPNVWDIHGHGTGVMGMAAASTDDAVGIAGASFKCRAMPVAVMSTGYQIINMYDGIIYAAENGCKVINVSIGRPSIGFQWEQDVIDYVTEQLDVLVVAAAGNTNAELDFYPASYRHVVSAAHSDGADRRWVDATYSTYVDVMAPGANIFTTWAGNRYTRSWGSSFASPLTAGVAALVRSAFPHLSAAQAGELVRVTAFDVYNVGSNGNFREKLGKGRLDAFRALSMEATAKSIRMKNFAYYTSTSNTIFSGDTVSLTADFVNYLKAVSENAKVVLSSSSPYITLVDSTFALGEMATMQQKNNTQQPFRFIVADDAPADLIIKFRLGFSDTDYDDYQYFEISINAPYLAIPFNTITFTLTSNSRAGYYDAYNRFGSGITSNGSQTFAEGGLIVARSSSKVSDNVLTNISGVYKDNDFKILSIPQIDQKTPFYTEASATFADTVNTINPPVGVHIQHRVKGRTNTPHHQYVILEYDITNTSGTAMDSLLVGLYYDWNLGTNPNKNYADWDNTREFGYAYGVSGSGYAAVKAISDKKTYFALDFQNVGGDNINTIDGFTSAEKFQTLANRISRRRAGFNTAGGDIAHVVGMVLNNFDINETRTVTFVVMLAPTLTDLRNAHDAAVLATDVSSSISPTPIVHNTLCDATDFTITPQGGTNFRLYETINTQTPIQEGTSFTLAPSDLGRTFYITCTDSVLEGNHTTVQFSVRQAMANFTTNELINIDENPTAFFTDQSQNAVAWQWNFGDGNTSSLQHPAHNYTRQGVYTVTLTITDNGGCTNSFSKSVSVVRKSPTPRVATSLYACDNEPLEVRPFGTGTNFKFYDKHDIVLGVGRSIEVAPLRTDTLYVSNIDSTLESDKVMVKINWMIFEPNFLAYPSYDTVLYDQIQFHNTSTGTYPLSTTTWDFGDGSPLRYGQIVSYQYAAQGSYTVRMTARNTAGCEKILEHTFLVGKKSPTPEMTNQYSVCKDESITIRPTGGSNFKFYTHLDSLPIAQGRTITLIGNSSMPRRLYVTNADSLIESDPVLVNIGIRQVNPNFDFVRELYLDEQTQVNFTDFTSDAVAWTWDFGNGQQSHLRNPRIQFNAQGTYTIRLSVQNSYGCIGTSTKELVVFRRSPKPVLTDIFICKYDSTTIVPPNGTRFNFYDSPTTREPIHTGRFYNTGFLKDPKTFWVTNLDSALESPATRIKVGFSRPSSNFSMSTDTLNLFVTDTLFVEDQTHNSTSWYWNFGNNQIATTKTAYTMYEQIGEYEVMLIARDSLGCIDSLTQKLLVIDKPVITGYEPDAEAQILVYPNPSSDYLHVYIELKQTQNVQVIMFNGLGQQVLQSPIDSITKKQLTFDLRQLRQGMYFVQLITKNKIITRKVALER